MFVIQLNACINVIASAKPRQWKFNAILFQNHRTTQTHQPPTFPQTKANSVSSRRLIHLICHQIIVAWSMGERQL